MEKKEKLGNGLPTLFNKKEGGSEKCRKCLYQAVCKYAPTEACIHFSPVCGACIRRKEGECTLTGMHIENHNFCSYGIAKHEKV